MEGDEKVFRTKELDKARGGSCSGQAGLECELRFELKSPPCSKSFFFFFFEPESPSPAFQRQGRHRGGFHPQ